MASPIFLAHGHTPTVSDTRWFILQRILGATIDVSGGGTGGAGMVGVVNPEGVVTATPGTNYTNTLLQSFWIKESGVGNTGWQQFV